MMKIAFEKNTIMAVAADGFSRSVSNLRSSSNICFGNVNKQERGSEPSVTNDATQQDLASCRSKETKATESNGIKN